MSDSTENKNALQPANDTGLSPELESKIPNYENCSAEQKKALDEIINNIDTGSVETAASFGDEVLDQLSEDMMAVQEAAAEGSSFAGAIEEHKEMMAKLSLDENQDAVKEIMSKGGDFANKAGKFGKRNWKQLALGGAGVVAAPFTAGLSLLTLPAAAGWSGVNEYKRSNTEKGKVEALKNRLKGNMGGIEKALKKVNEKRKQIKPHRDRMQDLRESYEDSIFGSAIYIAAGREAQNRVAEEIQTLKEENNPANADRLRQLQDFQEMFGQKMVLLEATFADGSQGLVDVERNQRALVNVTIALQSIAAETPRVRGKVAQAIMALEQWDFAEKAQDFRDIMDEIDQDTRTITKKSEEVSRDMRLDSPKQLAKRQKRLQQTKQDFTDSKKLDAAFSEASTKARKDLMKTAEELLKEYKNKDEAPKTEDKAENKEENKTSSVRRKRRRAGGNGPAVG